MTPAWILDIFAALMVAVAGLGACRLIAARPWSRPSAVADIDAAHVLMGIAMAGTLASALRTLPDGAWAAIFALVTGWFAWRVAAEARQRREASPASGHHLPHLVHAPSLCGTSLIQLRSLRSNRLHRAASPCRHRAPRDGQCCLMPFKFTDK